MWWRAWILITVGSLAVSCADRGSGGSGSGSGATSEAGTGSDGPLVDFGDSGNCVVDDDCPGRGEICDPVTRMCTTESGDHSSTADDSPPASFTDKPIPFFRGEVCTAANAEVKAGSQVPVLFRPCLHPCMTGGTNIARHIWSCLAGLCTSLSPFYTVGSGDNCPAEAWGKFPEAQCNYTTQMSMGLGPITLDATPVEGVLELEVPFLTNSQVQEVHDYGGLDAAGQEAQASPACLESCMDSHPICLENCLLKELAFNHLQEQDRVIQIDLRSAHPAPPDDCDGNPACQCFPIGFD